MDIRAIRSATGGPLRRTPCSSACASPARPRLIASRNPPEREMPSVRPAATTARLAERLPRRDQPPKQFRKIQEPARTTENSCRQRKRFQRDVKYFPQWSAARRKPWAPPRPVWCRAAKAFDIDESEKKLCAR